MPPSVASASEAEHRLFQYLFEDYNEIIRPVANVSHPVVIQFEVSMSQLVKVVSAWSHKMWSWGSPEPAWSQPYFYHSPVNINLTF